MATAVQNAEEVLTDDEAVRFGIFGAIAGSGYFPPREFLNEFLMVGHDPCDQDGRASGWQPFVLTPAEYDEVKAWWVARHPGAAATDFGVGSWEDWVQVILRPEERGLPDGPPCPAEPGVDADRGCK